MRGHEFLSLCHFACFSYPPGKRPSSPTPVASIFAPRNQIPPPLPKNLLSFPEKREGTMKLST